MSAHVELEQAARLHRAEDRWLDQCADRLRRSSRPRPTPAEPVESTPATATTAKEAVR